MPEKIVGGQKRMRKGIISITGIALFAAVIICAAGLPAAAGPVSASANLVSRYIWRGQDLLPSNDMALQPSVTYTLPQGVSLNAWGSFGFGGPNEKDELDELDFTASYSGEISGRLSYTVGHTYYTFHTAGPDESQETFAGVTLTKVEMKPAIMVYGDWGSDVSRGYYVNISGSKDFKVMLAGEKTMTLGLSAGYCDGQWSMEPGISDVNFSLSMPLKMKRITLTPSVNYTYVPDKASSAKGTTSPPKINSQNELWAGIGITLNR